MIGSMARQSHLTPLLGRSLVLMPKTAPARCCRSDCNSSEPCRSWVKVARLHRAVAVPGMHRHQHHLHNSCQRLDRGVHAAEKQVSTAATDTTANRDLMQLCLPARRSTQRTARSNGSASICIDWDGVPELRSWLLRKLQVQRSHVGRFERQSVHGVQVRRPARLPAVGLRHVHHLPRQ